jgi:DNA-binding transcriptional LysR family regulator
MELRHLRYFVAVAEELHFGRAAERIGIEQSPLSRAIRELEGDLGVRLFTRNSRSTRITPAGETFLAEARRILKAVSLARKATAAIASGARARLRIGISDSIAQPRLARLLARCRVEQPNVEFIVIDRSERRQVSGLREGLLDVDLALHLFAPMGCGRSRSGQTPFRSCCRRIIT